MKLIRLGQRKRIIILMIITIAVILSIYPVIHFGKTMIALRNDINHHSHMSTLSAGISEELEDYYKRNDRYPENLQISRVSILKMMYPHKKPEGPNIMDYFNGFKYSTDGNSYNIIWEARHGDTIYTHKEEGLKGELPRTELYINGELLKGR